VIVSRINDGHYKEPYSTLTASGVSVGENGTLPPDLVRLESSSGGGSQKARRKMAIAVD
jgi:hypothetical protein